LERAALIDETRTLPASMLVIGVLMLGSFLIVATSMVAAVIADDRPTLPDVELLVLPDGIEVLDSHSTCDASECDGYGLVLDRPGVPTDQVIEEVAENLRGAGWTTRACGLGETCLRKDGLGVMLAPWSMIDDTLNAPIRASLEEQGIDQKNLVYLRYHRCGDLHPCR
jgi:hypothetical protein